MFRFGIFFLMILLHSCSLFDGFRKGSFTYTENGVQKTTSLMVPKKYNRVERTKDSAGNEQQTYHYPGGAFLYFARTKDSLKELQPIDPDDNIPRILYGSEFFKGIDSNNLYWRENRKYPFRSGYRFVHFGNDWRFDSSLNYFTLHVK